ncbi:hypothetical protein NE237_003849 [Protea cynaroides]|uniref:Uncharacterized protein n=1 Tax=Protea cynaroides TaxID=273540 RepID=A0A9Q0QST9_9MAGN|nr:hypothetical protein NE237_003849 [Protea cynaroides]
MGLVELLVLFFLGMKLNNHYEFNVMKIRDSRLNVTKEMVNYIGNVEHSRGGCVSHIWGYDLDKGSLMLGRLDSYMTGQTFVEGVVERVDNCSGDITIKDSSCEELRLYLLAMSTC